jgi:hypothetical protein
MEAWQVSPRVIGYGLQKRDARSTPEARHAFRHGLVENDLVAEKIAEESG